MILVTLVNSVTIDLALGAVRTVLLEFSKSIEGRVSRWPFYGDEVSKHGMQEWKDQSRLRAE